MADPSRAIAVIGMHRSGTSAVARGLLALHIYLGGDFLDVTPENPTGYWEDRGIVELNERVLKALGLTWYDDVPIDPADLTGWKMWRLRRETIGYLRKHFISWSKLWGFKDPRTIRLLPFWRQVLHECKVEDSYLLVIRNPSSVAASLYVRQQTSAEEAQRLWLVYMVPFLNLLVDKPVVVLDYDLLMQDPVGQFERIAQKLAIAQRDRPELEKFAGEFLDQKLRHTVFAPDQIEASTHAGALTRDAYGLLWEVANDRREVDASFWNDWRGIQASFDSALAAHG
jgi:O-antigen biosynthesis protein